MGWRELRAARIKRDLKRVKADLDLSRRDANAWRRQAELSESRPLNKLKGMALEILANRVSESMAKATDAAVKQTIGDIEKACMENAEIRADEDPFIRATIMRVRVPEANHNFCILADELDLMRTT